MTPVSVSSLIDITQGKLLQGEINGQVQGVSVDTRTLTTNDVYVAFEGERVDGHRFVPQAIQQGASAILVTKTIELHNGSNNLVPVILVDNPLSAIQAMARHERQSFQGPVVGVTGSNGKTTTKEMLGAVFQAKGNCLFTRANQNNELGLPLTILQRNEAHCSIVLEMGMRGLGQIALLARIAKPNAGVITNIGQSHMELLGSQEGIANAKAELLDALPEDGVCVLPLDDVFAQKISNRFKGKPLWYSIAGGADAFASNIRMTTDGTWFTAHVLGQVTDVFIPSFGRHNVGNALSSLLMGAAYGLSIQDMANHLSKVSITSGRLTVLNGKNNQLVIDDCYNASPVSMKASIDVLSDLAKSYRVAILGDMFELGEYTEKGHQEVGAYLTEKKIDITITIGSHAKRIASEAINTGSKNVHSFDNIESALFTLDSLLPKSSTILVKASRGMHFERIVQHLTKREV